MGWEGDNLGGDPFDPSADCFGHAIEDVDPFQGHDSFNGDKEWTQFNDDDDDDGFDDGFGVQPTEQRTRKSSDLRTEGDSIRTKDKSSRGRGNRQKNNQRLPPSNGREQLNSSNNGSSRHNSADDENRARTSRSSTTSSRRQRTNDSNPTSLENFVPKDEGVNPFHVGMANAGFADFGNAFGTTPKATESPRSTRKPASSSRERGQARVFHDRAGRVQRLTSTEQKSRSRHSESRRSAVKDSIFSSLGDFDDSNNPDKTIDLSSFLSEKSGRGKGRRKGDSTGDSVEEKSTQSAPAADHGHYRQRQRRQGSTSHARLASSNDDPTSPRRSPRRSTAGKSLPRLPPPGSRRRSKSGSLETQRDQKLTLDVAALAEHGHLEIVDGKMRLVLDVETLTR